MSRKQEREETQNELTSDDLALLAAVLVVIADAVALWAVVAARNEKSNGDDTTSGIISPLAAVISQFTGFPAKCRSKKLRSALKSSHMKKRKRKRTGRYPKKKGAIKSNRENAE
ncbi:hypothetical protein ACX93W_06110 [Paenibacillus sp. CAU 1782]